MAIYFSTDRCRRRTLIESVLRLFRRAALINSFVLFAVYVGHSQAARPTEASIIGALRQGDFKGALHECDLFLRTSPRSSKVWTLRAVALERENRTKDAVDSYRQALRWTPDYLPALEGAAQLEYITNPKESEPLLRKILDIEPSNKTAHAMLGVVEFKEGDFSKAAEDFDRAEAVAASQPAALIDHALCLVHLGHETDAVPLLQKLLILTPSNKVARYDLALLQWRASDSSSALATLAPMLVTKDADSRSLRLAAAIHEADGETPDAVQLLRSAILANPDDETNYLDFAMLAFAHNSFSVGIDMVTAGLSRLPRSAELFMARGVLRGQNGEFEGAMDDFERARELDPLHSMVASAEGIAQSQRQNHAAALVKFREQVREHPQNALGYYLLAEAISWASPDDKDKAPQEDALKEAIAVDAKATVLDPKMLEAWDLLASLYLQNGQADEAADASRRALAIRPDDQQALYTLILALRKTGSKEEVRGLVQRLTELRKQEQVVKGRQSHYGQLVEVP